jgi:hypothetical protein
VFPQRDGTYRDPNTFLDLVKDAIRAYDRCHPAQPLRVINLHSLRHTRSTVAGKLGASDAVRMNRLDQSTVAVNQHYTDAQQTAMEYAASGLADALDGGMTPGVLHECEARCASKVKPVRAVYRGNLAS